MLSMVCTAYLLVNYSRQNCPLSFATSKATNLTLKMVRATG